MIECSRSLDLPQSVWGSQGDTVVKKNPLANAGGAGLIPGLGRSPGVGNSNPLQYPCLENSMDRGDLWAAINGVTKSQMHAKCLTPGLHLRVN